MDLRGSLNLPDPDFTIAMKADLPRLEPEIQKGWDEAGLYNLIQQSRKDDEPFVLHDGPPYTNSPIHIGTALNKTLKDMVVKSQTLMGHRAPYVPGFDNHGLPIEQAVAKAFSDKKERPSPTEFRQACRDHARKYIDIQTTQFKRLGVFGLWEKPYMTMDFKFEAAIIRVFKSLSEKGFVYRGLRPTLWSPSAQTALADTEIIYKEDHVSKAIFVAFPLVEDKSGFSQGISNLSTIIWTTTPWTIPANLAVAFNPTAVYAVVEADGRNFLLAEALIEKVGQMVGWTSVKKLFTVHGDQIENSVFKHPVFDRTSLAVLADYVTLEDGTGVVHTAPGHGRDDFYTGLKYNLPVLTPVDARGYLTEEAGEFAGVFYRDCDSVVVKRLEEVGALLASYDYKHSYPYAERDEKPVIFRATEQWFVKLDHEGLRPKMLEEIEKVQFFPANGKGRLTGMIANRPDWCISRQRPWGVGIPIFFGAQSGEPVFDPVAIEAIAQLVEAKGSDAWFSEPPEAILPPNYKHPVTGETEFKKETDVLDVWFDSGSTSIAVLARAIYPEWKESLPADLYLEGSDQHRGWFNSSLVLGTAVSGAAPYKNVMTCGFVMDDQGRKMSKRLGNIVEPVEACDQLGADVIRYWVASVDYANDVPCSMGLLKQFGEQYRNVRNTLRFLLSNLYDVSTADLGPVELVDLDKWIVGQTAQLVTDCLASYRSFDFGGVITRIHNFCRSELSNFYLDVVKDRLYCDAKESPERRSAQKASSLILDALVKLLAPILPHTAEETWQRMIGRHENHDYTRSIHIQRMSTLPAVDSDALNEKFDLVLSVRRKVNAAFEIWKAEHAMKDSQDAIVDLTTSQKEVEKLGEFEIWDLATLLKVSWINLKIGEEAINFQPSPYLKCERSRLRRPDVAEVEVSGETVALSKRDRSVLGIS